MLILRRYKMAEEQSYYQKLLNNANENISKSLPNAAATDDQMFARYLDRYKSMGQTAMRDTIGQTNALTGGYANSYSQNVGQQAYNEYLKGANDQMLNYAMQSKEMALKQDEYANNLASAQYARDMAEAQLGASYGDFNLYGNIFGQPTADAWKAMWDKMNPGLAGSSGGSGGGGWYPGSDTTGNGDELQRMINELRAEGKSAEAINSAMVRAIGTNGITAGAVRSHMLESDLTRNK